MSLQRLFVYGTLKSTFQNEMAKLLRENAFLLGSGWVPGEMYCVEGWSFLYPIATYLPGSSHKVFGEIFEFQDRFEQTIKTLDRYEGVEDNPIGFQEYQRVAVPVNTSAGQTKAWLYTAKKERFLDLKPIESGDFEAYLKERGESY